MSPRRDDEEEAIDFFGDEPRPGRGRDSAKKTDRAEARAAQKAQKHQRRQDAQKRRAAEKQADARASSSRRKGRKLADDFFGEEVVEAPAEGADVYRSASRKAKFQRGLIKTTLFVVAPLALGGNVAVLGAVMNQEAEEVDPVQATSEHKPLAITAVEEYLAGEQDGEQDGAQPLPGVELIGWDHAVKTHDGQEVLQAADLDSETLEEELPQAVSYETHHLSLRSTGGTFYTAQVQVAYSDIDGAWVTSQPSITADVPEAGGSEGASGAAADEAFPSLPEAEASEPLESAAATWAEAYYSGSPSILKQTLGDGREDTSYMPMPLAEDVEVDVSSAAIASGAELYEDAEGEENPDRVVARVEVEASWPDFDADADSQEHPMSGFNDAVELDSDGTVVDPDGVDDDSTVTPEEPAFDAEEDLVVIPEVEGVEYDPEPGEHEVGSSGLEVTAEPEEDAEFQEDSVTQWEFGTDDGEDTGDSDTEDPHVATVSYDVLIVEAHTATPRIVAWGAPGSGADLEAFDNAEVGRLLEDTESTSDQ